jgi:hypothetical protein
MEAQVAVKEAIKHQPATPLPELAVNINGDLGVKDWRRDQPMGMTQRFTLDEKREVARRANAYPKLVQALRAIVRSTPGGFAGDPLIAARRSAETLLHELGEDSLIPRPLQRKAINVILPSRQRDE